MIEADGGASYPGRRATRLAQHGREIKMLRPICAQCEDNVGGNRFLPNGWWNTCEHDPYVSYAEKRHDEPVYQEQADGSLEITGTRTKVKTVPTPNWVSISQSGGLNSGRGPERALRRGYIFPQQLRSPLWPEGIKRRCQFMECYSEDLKHYPGVGWFCRDEEAALVYSSDQEETLITAPIGRKAEKAKQKQLQDLVSVVKAMTA